MKMLKTVSRPSQFREFLSMMLAMALVVQPLLTSAALAAPRGARVAHGNVRVSSSGDRTVIHASDRSIINYASFDIAGHETVQFIQPNELAKVLNRIPSATPTQIYGALLANGQVYIVNPAGVYFGKGAKVDVARLVAAGASLSNGDFLRGRDHFTDVKGAVENRGSIEARVVQLIGQRVANRGLVAAPTAAWSRRTGA
jgi:filamentous hemagglutinin family protein